jgi:response regulator of citrate/malate metabolism
MIVIIEDDEISGRLLVKMIREYFEDKEFQWFKSLNQGIKFLSNFQSVTKDILLLDLYFEDGKAWELLEQLKSGQLSFEGRIILMPGIKPDEEESQLVNLYQPDKVLVKPIDLNELKDILSLPLN